MKRPKLWSRHNLPEELWSEILSRLPVKSLLRFRCVRKQWRDLIDDPYFARLHLRHFSNNRRETHLLVHPLNQTLLQNKVQVRCVESLKVTSKLHIPLTILHFEKWCGYWHAFSSIDGLFMLKRSIPGRSLELMLWNPATRKTLILPPSPGITTPVFDLFVEEFGLGFDPSVNNYKHVRVLQTVAGGLYSIAVYSLATRSWKMTRCDQGNLQRFQFPDCDIRSSLCLKGFLFRLAAFSNSVHPVQDLVSFDFRSEALASIKLPVGDVAPLNLSSSQSLTMVDDGCSLAVVLCSRGSGSVWVLEGLGAAGIKSCTWSKRHSFSSTTLHLDGPACCGSFFNLRNNGEMLFWWISAITSHNLKTNDDKVILKKCTRQALPYIESLIALS